MDLYVLDTDFNTVAVVDSYNSLIWTDRYQLCGDFELYLPASKSIAETFKQDYYLWSKHSDRMMIIESVTVERNAEDGDMATITGRSLESILDRRVIWGLKVLSGSLQDAVETLLNECIINPSKPERKIDNFIFEASDDPVITTLEIDTQYTGDNLYDVITNLCSERGIGFKVTLNDQKQFVFQLYAGEDRTYDQIKNPYVTFSPEFDNLLDSKYVESREEYKNVTLVGGEGEGEERRYTAVGNTSGLARRELFTDARDVSSDSDEDFTESFDFSMYAGQAFKESSKSFVSDANFNSCMVDVSRYAGRVIRISIPKYNGSGGTAPGYSTILVNSSKQYISTLQTWEPYDTASDSQETATANRGSLADYEILLPTTARYLYTSMYSATAINNDVYYGELDDFECASIKLSDTEYIALLRQRGSEKLSEAVEVVSLECEVDSSQMFVYGKDFFIGDVLQIDDGYGHNMKYRMLELIYSEDESGLSIYPTFTSMEYERPEDTGTLPDTCEQLAYIESTGTQYINTGFQPDQDTRIVMDIEVTGQTASTICIFGTRDEAIASAVLSCALWSMSKGTEIRSDYFGDTKTVSFNMPGRRVQIDKHGYICSVSNTVITNELDLGHAALNLYLLTCNNAGAVNAAYNTSAKLYSCKIYDKGTLVRDFVPVLYEGVSVGLFDLVGQQFYGNAGTGSFTMGKE